MLFGVLKVSSSGLSAISSCHGIEIYLYVDDTQLHVHLTSQNEATDAIKRLCSGIDDIVLWSLFMHL